MKYVTLIKLGLFSLMLHHVTTWISAFSSCLVPAGLRFPAATWKGLSLPWSVPNTRSVALLLLGWSLAAGKHKPLPKFTFQTDFCIPLLLQSSTLARSAIGDSSEVSGLNSAGNILNFCRIWPLKIAGCDPRKSCREPTWGWFCQSSARNSRGKAPDGKEKLNLN